MTPPTADGAPAAVQPPCLAGNRFHRCQHSCGDVLRAAADLQAVLAAAPPNGLAEQPLLRWFGASTQRMSLLAYAEGHLDPTYVAREFVMADMRADFALLEVPADPAMSPRLLLVECQGALHNSLFRSGGRSLKYWGRDFLDGFSQVVDWHFSEHYTQSSQAVASLTAHCQEPLSVSFMLVAGLRRFAGDALSRRRLAWWGQRITLSSRFQIKRFDDVAIEARHWALQGPRRELLARSLLN